MTARSEHPPLSRPIKADKVPAAGTDFTLETTADERAAVASDLKLPAVAALSAAYRITPQGRRVKVTGEVRARVTQICVASLEPFEADLIEPVEIVFSDKPPREGDDEADAPDPLVNGIIDLGHVTTEFLALGLDPYPRKPGTTFDADGAQVGTTSPFAALRPVTGKDGMT